MMPRLKLLREFLTDDGVIFVSIDDNEVHWLRGLMDELFGEERLIGQMVWRSRNFADSRPVSGLSVDHEYVLAYGRSETARIRGKRRDEAKYANPDDDARGPWTSCSLLGKANAEERPNLHYNFTNPKTQEVFNPEPLTGWICSKATMEKNILEKRILWPKKAGGRPRVKIFLNELRSGFLGYPSVIDGLFTSDGTEEMRDLFGEKSLMFPKPSLLIRELIEQVLDIDDVVLDAFSGSGTTGHAILQMNKADSGSRRFVLIESESYADSLTAERLRRVIKGVPKTKDDALQKGLGGSFSFVEVGNAMHLESLLKGDKLRSYADLASYVFYTATGEEFDERAIKRKTNFIGESAGYDVYLLYEPDMNYLKNTALTLDMARSLPKGSGKQRLVFAPTKYLDSIHLEENRIDFCQLPFEIYKAVKPKKA